MQAIVTQYHGATDIRGSRIKATANAGSVMVPYEDVLDVEGNHARAALMLCDKFGWGGVLAVGTVPSERGNVYVFVSRKGPAPARAQVRDPYGTSYRLAVRGKGKARQVQLEVRGDGK